MGGCLGTLDPAGVESSTWAVATVNPPAANRLDASSFNRVEFATYAGIAGGRRASTTCPGTPGDRRCGFLALAMVAAVTFHRGSGPGLVVPAARRSRSIELRSMGPGRGERSLRPPPSRPGASTSSPCSCRRSTSRKLLRPGGLPPSPPGWGIYWGSSVRSGTSGAAGDRPLARPLAALDRGGCPELAPSIAGDDPHSCPTWCFKAWRRSPRGHRPMSPDRAGARVCVLTPQGRGAVAVVRIWGPRAMAVADASFRPRRSASWGSRRRDVSGSDG